MHGYKLSTHRKMIINVYTDVIAWPFFIGTHNFFIFDKNAVAYQTVFFTGVGKTDPMAKIKDAPQETLRAIDVLQLDTGP